jgi:hypothetical protein
MAAGKQWKAPAWQVLCALCRACNEWPEPLLYWAYGWQPHPVLPLLKFIK